MVLVRTAEHHKKQQGETVADDRNGDTCCASVSWSQLYVSAPVRCTVDNISADKIHVHYRFLVLALSGREIVVEAAQIERG